MNQRQITRRSMGGIGSILTSRRFLIILIILVTHYATVYYYTTSTSRTKYYPSNLQDAQQIEMATLRPFDKDPYSLRDSIIIKFPVNKLYVERAKPGADNGPKFVEQPAVKVDFNEPGSLVRNDTSLMTLAPRKPSTRPKLILAWTKLTQRKPLWGITTRSFSACEYKNCAITGDRKALSRADILLFRVRELKTVTDGRVYRPYVRQLDYSDMPLTHHPNQLWMDINQESPVYTHAGEEVAALNDVFNISVNYMFESDHTLSYIPLVKVKATPTSSRDYSKGKTKMAVWFVSHCNATSGRDKYVEELKKYNITVDIIGKCSGKSDGCSPGDQACYLKLRQQYKFYLAFENSVCKEYITEKYWNTLTSDSYNIPVALGASLTEYKMFSPPNSYLHTRNFTTVKALAEYMHKVDSDDSLFNTYHQWRTTHYIEQRKTAESLHCYICRQAHLKTDGHPKYKQLSKYWNLYNNCEVKPEPIN